MVLIKNKAMRSVATEQHHPVTRLPEKNMTKPNRPAPRSPIALAIAAAICAGDPEASIAQEAPAPEKQLEKIAVTGEVDGVRVEIASSPKFTADLLNTPQTITVVTQQTISEQNLLSLRDVLSTVPGITFGAGEGGGGYGDSLTLRGFTGSNDVTIDGFRDSAQYTRSDTFNLEQVEVINGASSVFSGAGAAGGSINLVSKTARLGNSNQFNLGAGTDSYGRATADVNREITDTTALRINAMVHRNDVPGRDVEELERWGIAPTVAFGLGTATTVSLSYLHQTDDNTPQYGIPTYLGRVMQDVDREAYYGYRNVDRQKIDVDAFTMLVSHSFEAGTTLRNQTRWQQVDQISIVNPPQGSFCLSTGTQPDGAACATPPAVPVALQPGQYQPSGPRGTTRDTRNEIIVTQTDLLAAFETGPLQHTMTVGFSLSSESYFLDNGNSLRNPGGALPNPVLPVTLIADPDSLWNGPVNFIRASTTRGSMDDIAGYVFDDIRFAERWSFNGGARFDRVSSGFSQVNYATPANGGAATPLLPGSVQNSLLSWRAGLVFNPVPNSSIYLAYGNSETPSIATVNGTCTITGANNNCNLEPEEAENIELGTKWDVLGNRLSLTASISRNERTNYRVNDPGNPDNPSGQQTLDGSARVDALILGVSGLITEDWSIFANYTFLDSEVLQGASDFVSDAGQDYTRGDPLLNVPRNAASLWTTWDAIEGLQLGYGLTWQDEVYTSQHTAATGAFPPGSQLPTTPGYVVHRAMATWSINRNLSLQLNINNIFDKEYLTRVRTQPVAWATPGEARSFVLTAALDLWR
jgi:catecholate siderophore receptor